MKLLELLYQIKKLIIKYNNNIFKEKGRTHRRNKRSIIWDRDNIVFKKGLLGDFGSSARNKRSSIVAWWEL